MRNELCCGRLANDNIYGLIFINGDYVDRHSRRTIQVGFFHNFFLIHLKQIDFSDIYNETNAISQQIWMFQQYERVIEYMNTPTSPPPFTVFEYVYMLFVYCRRRIDSRSSHSISMSLLHLVSK